MSQLSNSVASCLVKSSFNRYRVWESYLFIFNIYSSCYLDLCANWQNYVEVQEAFLEVYHVLFVWSGVLCHFKKNKTCTKWDDLPENSHLMAECSIQGFTGLNKTPCYIRVFSGKRKDFFFEKSKQPHNNINNRKSLWECPDSQLKLFASHVTFAEQNSCYQ